MGHIAQGVFGTAGGLDQVANSARVTDALFLINSALDPPPTQGIAPFGIEKGLHVRQRPEGCLLYIFDAALIGYGR